MTVTIASDLAQSAWSAAVTFWDDQPLLTFPLQSTDTAMVAYIDIKQRQVFYNHTLLEHAKLLDCLPAIFAHEIGHHLHYPHTLRAAADLHLLGEKIVPGFKHVWLNLFYDLLINFRVGHDATMRSQLVQIYRYFSRNNTDAMFEFYLSIYDTLWNPTQRILHTPPDDEIRNKADVFVQTFFTLSNIHEQFVFFCSLFLDYFLQQTEQEVSPDLAWQDVDAPSAEDYPDDLQPSAAAKRALSHAKRARWLPTDIDKVNPAPANSIQKIRQLASGLPGSQQQDFIQTLADRIYARHIETIISTLPTPVAPGQHELALPGSLQEWDDLDGFAAIDWVSSVSFRGEMAPLSPLSREFLTDDTPGTELGVPRIEIYLDTSGSMPDPSTDLNFMTLAAQVLAAFAIRKGAMVRAVIYSSGAPLQSAWLRSEHKMRAFLFNYSGGGTDFPFEIFEQNCNHDRNVIRVIISDLDFVYNLSVLAQHPRKLATFIHSANRSIRTVLLLHHVNAEMLKPHINLTRHERFQLIEVNNLQEFASASLTLARVLLGD